MGYYILGIIIFLLMIVFVADLVRQSRNNREIEDEDLYLDRYANKFYTNQYTTEFGEDIEKEIAFEEGKTNDMGVETIWQNVEHQAMEQRISDLDTDLQDVLPEDPDEDRQRR